MIAAIVLLGLALLGAIAFIVRGALDRRFARITAFEQTWTGQPSPVDERVRPLDFQAWLARFGKGFVA